MTTQRVHYYYDLHNNQHPMLMTDSVEPELDDSSFWDDPDEDGEPADLDDDQDFDDTDYEE